MLDTSLLNACIEFYLDFTDYFLIESFLLIGEVLYFVSGVAENNLKLFFFNIVCLYISVSGF